MSVIRPKINNYKISIKFPGFTQLKKCINAFRQNSNHQKHITSKQSLNFYIYRSPLRFVYTFFYSGHINVTSLKSEEDIQKSISHVYQCFNLPLSLQHESQIDNISASGGLNLITHFKSLKALCNQIERTKDEFDVSKVSYETQKFSGATLKKCASNYFKGKGCVLLFNNSKFIIVGCSSLEEIQNIHNWIEIVTFNAHVKLSK